MYQHGQPLTESHAPIATRSISESKGGQGMKPKAVQFAMKLVLALPPLYPVIDPLNCTTPMIGVYIKYEMDQIWWDASIKTAYGDERGV